MTVWLDKKRPHPASHQGVLPGWTELLHSLVQCAHACVCELQPACLPVVTDTCFWGLYLDMHLSGNRGRHHSKPSERGESAPA